ncbi:cilia- and flagella-associated protein 43 isoform X3 [Syngnathoides biaculeatus]|uniref:cilia- and flagella-associated protein 43 isoform X3 n=1 Tax=Syngnathoides biaculeatus TaxID=300417 RepID=UPI002ADD4989|nr:cilia- and flagella-associated protein 43 isoform X3 [Syngnathoides biaculeatus]
MDIDTDSTESDTETPSERESLSEDDLNYSETKEKLRGRMEEIRSTIQEMIRENESVPEIERLELKEFNVDEDRQKMHDAVLEEEISKVRDRIEMEILERRYRCDLIKRDYWDCLKVKDRAVKAFHTDQEVTNYPLKERLQGELDALKRVENKRMAEIARDQEKGGEDEAEEALAAQGGVTSSYSAELGLSHPYLYDQFSLHTTEQKQNQIIMLQDVIFQIKVALNTQFDKVYKQKVQEIGRVKERNKQVREILEELEVTEDLWVPVLSDREVPERVFVVDDSEIKAEKYLTPEEEKEKERKRLEEQKRLAAKEELKIKTLNYSVLMEEVMRNEEIDLAQKLKETSAQRKKKADDLEKFEKEVESFQESYDNLVADDKAQDKDFRKEFASVHKAHVDQLYKLFKRRPRGHKRNAMEELDSQRNMPEGLTPPVWERFCQIRRTKIDTEHKIKASAATLAEMEASLQKKREEDETAEQEIEYLAVELENLREEKKNFLTDITVQFLLKQGQVEVTNTDLIPDYSESILLHRGKVEELNRTIRTLGEQKIAVMVQTKDFRKGIIQVEWDNTMRRMQIEDLKNKERDIQKLRLTEDHKEYLKTDSDSRVCKQAISMKETQALQLKTYQKDVKYRKQKIRHLQAQAAMKEKKNIALDKQIQDMHVTVSQMRHIYEASATEENEAANTEQRYQEVLLVQRLKDKARFQMEKLAFLSAEAQRLRMRKVPSLVQIKYD